MCNAFIEAELTLISPYHPRRTESLAGFRDTIRDLYPGINHCLAEILHQREFHVWGACMCGYDVGVRVLVMCTPPPSLDCAYLCIPVCPCSCDGVDPCLPFVLMSVWVACASV